MNNNTADIAEKGVSDIAGVKREGEALPEKISPEIPCVAGTENVGPSSPDEKHVEDKSSEISVSAPENDEDEAEKEFEELIRGKYKDVYKRRTENIVRRRLKAVKNRVSSSNEPNQGEPEASARRETSGRDEDDEVRAETEKETVFEKTEESLICPIPTDGLRSADATEEQMERKRFDADAEKAKNRARPRENGVGGSIGMVTGINVDALTGNDVLDLLKRVGAGEKIRFCHYDK